MSQSNINAQNKRHFIASKQLLSAIMTLFLALIHASEVAKYKSWLYATKPPCLNLKRLKN